MNTITSLRIFIADFASERIRKICHHYFDEKKLVAYFLDHSVYGIQTWTIKRPFSLAIQSINQSINELINQSVKCITSINCTPLGHTINSKNPAKLKWIRKQIKLYKFLHMTTPLWHSIKVRCRRPLPRRWRYINHLLTYLLTGTSLDRNGRCGIHLAQTFGL